MGSGREDFSGDLSHEEIDVKEAIVYAIILIGLLTGFTYLSAIGAGIAAIAWAMACGIAAFVVAKISAERWSKLDGRA